MKKIKMARITTVPMALTHILKTIEILNESGFDVFVITSKSTYGDFLKKERGIKVVELSFSREISILNDFKSLWKLYKHFRKNNYNIIHSSTPKAGLIAALAGALAGVDNRLHTFTGQRWATMKGMKKHLLKMADRIVVKLNTLCYADSNSQIQFLKDENVIKDNEIVCLGDGSFGGVDLERFNLLKNEYIRKEFLMKNNIPKTDTLFLYVGRVTKDKGINEIVSAFKDLEKSKLIIVGKLDQNHQLNDEVLEFIKENENIIDMGFQENPEYFMKACDVLVLPSYREGFGTVVIEAAACGTCSIGSNIPGLRDAIVDKETGILVKARNSDDLKLALKKLEEDKKLVRVLSLQAEKRARELFSAKRLSELQKDSYLQMLGLKK